MSGGERRRATARERAVRVLADCYDGRQRGRDLLDEWQQHDPLSPADAGLAAELVAGVLRHRITLEHIASRFYRGRWEGLRPSIRMLLATGIYQLCWLDRIPAHAAVDEAVKHARRFGHGIPPVANAILRKVSECRGEVVARPESPDPRRWLAIDAQRGRVFSEDILPDPARKPLDYLVAAMGHPMYLVERWHRRFKPALARQICESALIRPPLVLRPNLRRITSEELVARLVAAGHAAEPVEGSAAIIVRGEISAVEIPDFREGLCQPQDSTSQRVLMLAPPSPGAFVIDLCAGVGTKSTQAAELMNDEGIVLACDVDAAKLSRVAESAARLGLSIIRTCGVGMAADEAARVGRPPDLILVDAPCTNTGVLARRLEARYRASHKALMELVGMQREVLGMAASLAGPRTRIIYATCSIEQEENRDQAAWFCEQHTGWRVIKEDFALPDREHGGGYAVVLVQS
ncbi:MAG: hypothetical protein DCC65_10050 [Planctomycetota bacterium]|nr:MAG: hypothetical protein DCC65_10050 [Planctomycetota bacterium]